MPGWVVLVHVFQREVELHNAEWKRQVESVRRELGLGPGSEADIGKRLTGQGRERVTQVIRSAFRELERAGIPTRYLEYFAGCCVSHFDQTLGKHRLPVWLAARLNRIRDLEDPLPPGQYCIEAVYRDRVEDGAGWLSVSEVPQELPIINMFAVEQSDEWKLADLPFGFEVYWPYEVPSNRQEFDLEQLKRDLREQRGISMSWLVVGRLVALVEGQWVMLPVRVAKVSQPVPLARLFGLEEDTPLEVWPTVIPAICHRQAVYQVRCDDPVDPRHPRSPIAFRSLGQIRPFQPRVVADISLANEERPFVKQWKELVEFLAVHPALRGGRGRPRSRALPPGPYPYPRLVEMLYRSKLVAWAKEHASEHRAEPRPTETERKRLWEAAKREARHLVPKAERSALPDDVRRQVEADEPWRQAWRGANAAEQPP